MYESQANYKRRNLDRVKQWAKQWRDSHKEYRREKNREWKNNNKERVRVHRQRYRLKKLQERLRNEPDYAERYKKYCLEKATFIERSEAIFSTRLRFQVLRRDKFTCQYCGKKAPDVVLHVDHRIPKIRGGNSDMANLVTACAECNVGKGSLW